VDNQAPTNQVPADDSYAEILRQLLVNDASDGLCTHMAKNYRRTNHQYSNKEWKSMMNKQHKRVKSLKVLTSKKKERINMETVLEAILAAPTTINHPRNTRNL
jgi:arsenate reductase-like glutaredoxin family protein